MLLRARGGPHPRPSHQSEAEFQYVTGGQEVDDDTAFGEIRAGCLQEAPRPATHLVEHADGRGTIIVITVISPGPLGKVLLQKLIAIVALAEYLFEQVLIGCQCRCASLCTSENILNLPQQWTGHQNQDKV